MTNEEKKAVLMVREMANNGYALFGETPIHFAKRFNYDVKLIGMMRHSFYVRKGIKE